MSFTGYGNSLGGAFFGVIPPVRLENPVDTPQLVFSRVVLDLLPGFTLNPIISTALRTKSELSTRTLAFSFSSGPLVKGNENDNSSELSFFNSKLAVPSTTPEDVALILTDIQKAGVCPNVVTLVSVISIFVSAGLTFRLIDVLATVGELVYASSQKAAITRDTLFHPSVVSALLSAFAAEGLTSDVTRIWALYSQNVASRLKDVDILRSLNDNSESNYQSSEENVTVKGVLAADLAVYHSLRDQYAMNLAGSVMVGPLVCPVSVSNNNSQAEPSAVLVLEELRSLVREDETVPGGHNTSSSIVASLAILYHYNGDKTRAKSLLHSVIQTTVSGDGSDNVIDDESLEKIIFALSTLSISNDIRIILSHCASLSHNDTLKSDKSSLILSTVPGIRVALSFLSGHAARFDPPSFFSTLSQLSTGAIGADNSGLSGSQLLDYSKDTYDIQRVSIANVTNILSSNLLKPDNSASTSSKTSGTLLDLSLYPKPSAFVSMNQLIAKDAFDSYAHRQSHITANFSTLALLSGAPSSDATPIQCLRSALISVLPLYDQKPTPPRFQLFSETISALFYAIYGHVAALCAAAHSSSGSSLSVEQLTIPRVLLSPEMIRESDDSIDSVDSELSIVESNAHMLVAVLERAVRATGTHLRTWDIAAKAGILAFGGKFVEALQVVRGTAQFTVARDATSLFSYSVLVASISRSALSLYASYSSSQDQLNNTEVMENSFSAFSPGAAVSVSTPGEGKTASRALPTIVQVIARSFVSDRVFERANRHSPEFRIFSEAVSVLSLNLSVEEEDLHTLFGSTPFAPSSESVSPSLPCDEYLYSYSPLAHYRDLLQPGTVKPIVDLRKGVLRLWLRIMGLSDACNVRFQVEAAAKERLSASAWIYRFPNSSDSAFSPLLAQAAYAYASSSAGSASRLRNRSVLRLGAADVEPTSVLVTTANSDATLRGRPGIFATTRVNHFHTLSQISAGSSLRPNTAATASTTTPWQRIVGLGESGRVGEADILGASQLSAIDSSGAQREQAAGMDALVQWRTPSRLSKGSESFDETHLNEFASLADRTPLSSSLFHSSGHMTAQEEIRPSVLELIDDGLRIAKEDELVVKVNERDNDQARSQKVILSLEEGERPAFAYFSRRVDVSTTPSEYISASVADPLNSNKNYNINNNSTIASNNVRVLNSLVPHGQSLTTGQHVPLWKARGALDILIPALSGDLDAVSASSASQRLLDPSVSFNATSSSVRTTTTSGTPAPITRVENGMKVEVIQGQSTLEIVPPLTPSLSALVTDANDPRGRTRAREAAILNSQRHTLAAMNLTPSKQATLTISSSGPSVTHSLDTSTNMTAGVSAPTKDVTLTIQAHPLGTPVGDAELDRKFFLVEPYVPIELPEPSPADVDPLEVQRLLQKDPWVSQSFASILAGDEKQSASTRFQLASPTKSPSFTTSTTSSQAPPQSDASLNNNKDSISSGLLDYFSSEKSAVRSSSLPPSTAARPRRTSMTGRRHSVCSPPKSKSYAFPSGGLHIRQYSHLIPEYLLCIAAPPPTFEANVALLAPFSPLCRGGHSNSNGGSSTLGLRTASADALSRALALDADAGSFATPAAALQSVLLAADRFHSDLNNSNNNNGSSAAAPQLTAQTILLEETCHEAHADSARLEQELLRTCAQVAVLEARLNRLLQVRNDHRSLLLLTDKETVDRAAARQRLLQREKRFRRFEKALLAYLESAGPSAAPQAPGTLLDMLQLNSPQMGKTAVDSAVEGVLSFAAALHPKLLDTLGRVRGDTGTLYALAASAASLSPAEINGLYERVASGSNGAVEEHSTRDPFLLESSSTRKNLILDGLVSSSLDSSRDLSKMESDRDIDSDPEILENLNANADALVSSHLRGNAGEVIDSLFNVSSGVLFRPLNPVEASTAMLRRRALLQETLAALRKEESALMASLQIVPSSSAGEVADTGAGALPGDALARAQRLLREFETQKESIAAASVALEDSIAADAAILQEREDAALSDPHALRAWAGLSGAQARLDATRLTHLRLRAQDPTVLRASAPSSLAFHSSSVTSKNDARFEQGLVQQLMTNAIQQLSSSPLASISTSLRESRRAQLAELETQLDAAEASALVLERFAQRETASVSQLRTVCNSHQRTLEQLEVELEETVAEEAAFQRAVSGLSQALNETRARNEAEHSRVAAAVTRMRRSLAHAISARTEGIEEEVRAGVAAAVEAGRARARAAGAAALDAAKAEAAELISAAVHEVSLALTPEVHASVTAEVRARLQLERQLEGRLEEATAEAARVRALVAALEAESQLLEESEAQLHAARQRADYLVAVDFARRAQRSGRLEPPVPFETDIPGRRSERLAREKLAAHVDPSIAAVRALGIAPNSSSKDIPKKQSKNGEVDLKSASQDLWEVSSSLGLGPLDLLPLVQEAINTVIPTIPSELRAFTPESEASSPTNNTINNQGVSISFETDPNVAAQSMNLLDSLIVAFEDVLAAEEQKNLIASQNKALVDANEALLPLPSLNTGDLEPHSFRSLNLGQYLSTNSPVNSAAKPSQKEVQIQRPTRPAPTVNKL